MQLFLAPSALLILFLLTTSVGWAADSKTLVLGLDHSPPYSYKDENGAASGTLVDLMKKLANESKLSFEFVFCPWARCINLIESGQIDLLAGLSKTEQRQSHLLYLEPPIFSQKASYSFYVKDPKVVIESYSDLSGLVVGKLRGSQHFMKFDQDNNLNIVNATDIETLFSLLKTGRIDAFIHVNETIAPYLLEYDPEHSVIQSSFIQEVESKGYFTLSKHSGKTALYGQLSKALNTLQQQGAFEALER